jgi:hypothetical protein
LPDQCSRKSGIRNIEQENNNQNVQENNKNRKQHPDAPDETTEAPIKADLPEADYNGDTFTIYARA